MATLEDEHTDAATHDIPDALTPPQRQSPGPMLHDVWRVTSLNPVTLVAAGEAIPVKNRGIAGRREAVAKATAQVANPEYQYGTFVTVKHGEISAPILREQDTSPRDKWS
jgi:hypothetical protein